MGTWDFDVSKLVVKLSHFTCRENYMSGSTLIDCVNFHMTLLSHSPSTACTQAMMSHLALL